MLYKSAQDWNNAAHKRVLVYGMSGLGKTHLSNTLRDNGDWFHYSVDYRIGTHYMGQYIADNAKAHAMQVPFLRELLMTDSITIESNISFSNLTPVATYLGKPGSPELGGSTMAEYSSRQEQFRQAEIASLYDTERFITRAQQLYGYPNFICDSGGSICEWVDPTDKSDPLLTALCENTLPVWIKGSDQHTQDLIKRFDKAPKPMAYQPEFLARTWSDYLLQNNMVESEVDPNAFIRWTYAKALAHRQPRYEAMADWGVTITADEVASVRTAGDFNDVIATALERRT